MSRPLHVHLLPSLFEPDELAGSIAVVIDVLRASTTIVHALAHGARAVIPCDSIEQAHSIANGFDGETVLGGERGGVQIEGFDFGNSPFDYTTENVGDRAVVFSTTNGTRALLRTIQAAKVIVGSFVNRSAVVQFIRADRLPVHLICAGTDGKITAEDVLFAGAVTADLCLATGDTAWEVTDASQIARAFYESAGSTANGLLAAIRSGFGGRNLIRLGYDADIERAATNDLFDIVPTYDSSANRISL